MSAADDRAPCFANDASAPVRGHFASSARGAVLVTSAIAKRFSRSKPRCLDARERSAHGAIARASPNCTYWRDECDASPKRRASLFTGKGSRSPFLEWREGPAQWDDLDRPRRGAARESRSHRALAAARPKGDRAPACGCSDSEVLGREKKCGTRMHLSNFLVETDLPDTLTLVSRVRQRIIRYALSGSERSQATV